MVAAFLLTAGLLTIVQVKVSLPMLLMERFFPTFGWLEILGLALYAAWITEKMLDPAKAAQWRLRLWTIFSVVFFGQLLIGLIGVDDLLMTGKLHLPVPAMIVAGPLYRAERFFMPILFVSTVMLVGPAWCSYLCYFGSWDALAAHRKKHFRKLSRWRDPARIGILFGVMVAALAMRQGGISRLMASISGLAFGLIGVAIMAILSRKSGRMVHCVQYCPIGLIANLIGKASPFRIRIKDGCDECLACSLVCRYDAMHLNNIRNQKPGLTCSLCGDCLRACKGNWIAYKFLGLKPATARALFLTLIVSLHAVFLGVARI